MAENAQWAFIDLRNFLVVWRGSLDMTLGLLDELTPQERARVGTVMQRAQAVLGSSDGAAHWALTTNRSLGAMSPLIVALTGDEGLSRVLAALSADGTSQQ